MTFITSILVFSILQLTAADGEWAYSGPTGPRAWKKMPQYKACAGKEQSPIRITRSKTKYSATLSPLVLHGFGDDMENMTVKNNGHSAVVTLGPDTYIQGGNLDGKYNAMQFHFHWGSENNKGSEHMLSLTSFPMEMHIVHQSAKYSTIQQAIEAPDGLVLLAFWFQLTVKDNPALSPIIKGVGRVETLGASATLEPFNLRSILPRNMGVFFRYQGSLSTPPCSEAVTWFVYPNTIGISLSQLKEFRSLWADKDKHNHLVDNYRPVQPLNNRPVLTNCPAVN